MSLRLSPREKRKESILGISDSAASQTRTTCCSCQNSGVLTQKPNANRIPSLLSWDRKEKCCSHVSCLSRLYIIMYCRKRKENVINEELFRCVCHKSTPLTSQLKLSKFRCLHTKHRKQTKTKPHHYRLQIQKYNKNYCSHVSCLSRLARV